MTADELFGRLIVPAGVMESRAMESDMYLFDQDEPCRNLRKAPDRGGKVVPVRLHQDVVDYLDMLAKRKGMRRSTFIRYIISLYLAKTVCTKHDDE
jgi:hypothetical protein